MYLVTQCLWLCQHLGQTFIGGSFSGSQSGDLFISDIILQRHENTLQRAILLSLVLKLFTNLESNGVPSSLIWFLILFQQTPEEPVKPKARRLVALQYNYSDSEDEETREERKARIVSTNTSDGVLVRVEGGSARPGS